MLPFDFGWCHLYPNFLQPTQTAEGFAGSNTEGGGSHLLHQLPCCRRREAAEDNQGKFHADFSSTCVNNITPLLLNLPPTAILLLSK